MKNKTAGWTLVELLIVVTIMSIIMVGISTFFNRALYFVRLIQAKTDVQRDARMILSKINRELRQAKASSVVIDRLNSDMPPYSRIRFETIKGSTMCYYQDGTTLLFQESRGDFTFTPRKLTENLRYIAFVYQRTDNNKVIHISICLEKVPYLYVPGTKALQVAVEEVRIMNE